MRRILRRLFNLNPGEGRAAIPFLLLGFLWSIGAFGCLTLSEGMFLEHIGAKGLPFSYLITAIVMCLSSTLLLLVLHRKSITHLLSTAIISVIASYLLCYFFISLEMDTKYFWYLFKVIGWVSPVVIYISFWAFIDQYYDLQSAKRCFCLFNSVLYLGDAFAGGIISSSIHEIGLSGLILFCSICLSFSIPLIFLIERRKKTLPEEIYDGNPPQNKFSMTSFVKKVMSSPFTLLLMCFYFLMQLIAITTEYTYMDSFEKHFGAPYHLTEFLGRLAMWVSLGNMVFGLFFYSRTVSKMGINNIILIAPLFFLSIFSYWSWHETLLLATIALIAREATSYTFDDNNLLLLISGVPSKVKNQVRISIESFFEPIGMLVGASLLFFLQGQSKWLGIGLAFLSLIMALILRSHYTKALFNNLMAHTLRFEKKTKDWISGFSQKEKKKMETQLLNYLKKDDEITKRLASHYLLKMENPSLPLEKEYYCDETIEKMIIQSLHLRPSRKKEIERTIVNSGKASIPELLNILQDEKIHIQSRLFAGKILSRLSLKEFRTHMNRLVIKEIENAYFYFYYAKNLEHDFEILRCALESSFQSSFDFIIQMIAIGASFEESEVLSTSIQNKNKKIKAHAIETLEKITNPILFEMIQPLIHQEKKFDHLKKEERGLSLNDLLARLASSPSSANKIVAETLKVKK